MSSLLSVIFRYKFICENHPIFFSDNGIINLYDYLSSEVRSVLFRMAYIL